MPASLHIFKIRQTAALNCLFLWMVVTPAWAQITATPEFVLITNNNSIAIVSYVVGSDLMEVDVPAFTNGYPVTAIDSYAFGDNLTKLVIPAGVTNIGEGVCGYCPFLTNIVVDAANPNYLSTNGFLFNKSMTLLLKYPGGLTNQDYAVSTNVTRIGAYAFSGCYDLLTLTIPTNVTSIGQGTFFECSITNVVIPSGVTSIESNTFLASGAESVTIPATVTNINRLAFQDCQNLTSVYFYGDAPSVDIYSFSYNGPVTAYYLPGKSGWSSLLDGVPTALWLPQIQTVNGSGISSAPFGFNVNWAIGQTVVVEASPNLYAPMWQPLQTNTLVTASTYFSDMGCTDHQSRFYRVRSQ